jgi:hypothetical protein
MNSFTSEDLLQFLYNEASPEKTAEIKAALATDWNLQEKMQLLFATQKQLDDVSYSPRQQSIDHILSYAEKAVEELEQHA